MCIVITCLPVYDVLHFEIKDSHRKNAPLNKTKAFTKYMNIRIWRIDTLNQLFIRGSYGKKYSRMDRFKFVEDSL